MAREHNVAFLIEVLERLLPLSGEIGGRLVWIEGHASIVRYPDASLAAIGLARKTAMWWERTARLIGQGNVEAAAGAAYRLGVADAQLQETMKHMRGGRKRARHYKEDAKKIVEDVLELQRQGLPKQKAFVRIERDRQGTQRPIKASTIANLFYAHAKERNAKTTQ